MAGYFVVEVQIPLLTFADSENNSGLNPNVSGTVSPTNSQHILIEPKCCDALA
jgi:hypothetical protein